MTSIFQNYTTEDISGPTRSCQVESIINYKNKNIERHTAHTFVSWLNPKQSILDKKLYMDIAPTDNMSADVMWRSTTKCFLTKEYLQYKSSTPFDAVRLRKQHITVTS